MTAIEKLKSDHRKVAALFASFDKARTAARKRTIFEELADALAVHAAIEEQHFYPAAMSKETDGVLLGMWAMAACYSAEPDGTVTLPFDPATGRLRDRVWARWLALDPVRMAAGHADALRSLRAVWVDAGRGDDFYLDLGAEAFAAAVRAIGIAEPVLHVELFDGTHSNLEWRYPLALRFLAERLAE